MLAAIAGAHGVRGEVRLKLFAESLASLRRHSTFAADGATLSLISVREGSHGPIARFAELSDRASAEALRGARLSVDRSSLPPPAEDEIYVVDLMGLPALAAGVSVGRVVGHENYGAGDLIEVEQEDGRRVLIPLLRCQLSAGVLLIDPAFLE